MNGREALLERIKSISEALRADDGLGSADSATPSHSHPHHDHPSNVHEALLKEKLSLLEHDRDATGRELSPDHVDKHVAVTAFGNQIAYVHNGYNLESTKALKPAALITRVSFIPIFPPVTTARSPDNRRHVHANHVSDRIRERLDGIRDSAIHGGNSFSGGKDSIIKRTDKFLDYNEPIITTLRSMDRCVKYMIDFLSGAAPPELRHVFADATAQNDRVIKSLQAAGASSRLSMARDYVIRLFGSSSTAISWVRHHSHYQTITVEEEVDPRTLAAAYGTGNVQVIDQLAAFAAPTLARVIEAISGSDEDSKTLVSMPLMQRTAIDELPPKWADFLYGRYLQGANFLVLPADLLFSENFLARCSECAPLDHRGIATLKTDWEALLVASQVPNEAPSEQPNLERFLAVWRRGESEAPVARAAGQFLLRLIAPLVERPPSTWEWREFALFSAAEGMAGVFSQLQNVATVVDGRDEFRLSETIVIDFGMSPTERGRLADQMADFGTQRVLSISAIGTFRFLHDALDQIQRSLSKAVEAWLAARPLEQSSVAHGRLSESSEHDEEAVLRSNSRFVKALEEITTDLTLLDDLVDGGISQRARSAAGAVEALHGRLTQMRTKRIPGFMSLDDFIDGRFSRESRSMAAAGRRYDELRRRVGELSALVSANIQIGQNREQQMLLDKIDRLTLFGITYYAGSILAYIFGPIMLLFVFGRAEGWNRNLLQVPSALLKAVADPPKDLEATDDVMKVFVFTLLLLLAIFIGRDVFGTLAIEIKDAPREWRKWIKTLLTRDNH